MAESGSFGFAGVWVFSGSSWAVTACTPAAVTSTAVPTTVAPAFTAVAATETVAAATVTAASATANTEQPFKAPAISRTRIHLRINFPFIPAPGRPAGREKGANAGPAPPLDRK